MTVREKENRAKTLLGSVTSPTKGSSRFRAGEQRETHRETESETGQSCCTVRDGSSYFKKKKNKSINDLI